MWEIGRKIGEPSSAQGAQRNLEISSLLERQRNNIFHSQRSQTNADLRSTNAGEHIDLLGQFKGCSWPETK